MMMSTIRVADGNRRFVLHLVERMLNSPAIKMIYLLMNHAIYMFTLFLSYWNKPSSRTIAMATFSNGDARSLEAKKPVWDIDFKGTPIS